jgi:membrane associated rhomboid family serine protease
MLFLLPLGPGERAPRLPPLTLAIVALNLLAFLVTLRFDTDAAARQETELERMAEWSLRLASQNVPALAARAGAPALRFLEHDTAWREELAGTAQGERLEAYVEEYRALKAAHPFFRFGFVPADITAVRLITHQFLHAGWLHLGFNMLFLWTVGALLEATLGAAVFGPLYLAGGVAAALAFAAASPQSVEPAVGASGAVAAAMGLFAVLHGREPVRLALVAAPLLVPRIYFVTWPAAVFLGLWVLEQLFFFSFGPTTLGVAFAAHLGGFVFGALAGIVVRLTAASTST